jgi:hypothetical protein
MTFATPSRVVRPIAILIDGYQRVFYTYGPLFGLILLTGLGGVLRIRWRPGRRPVLAWSPRTGSMLPWATAVVLLVFPIAVADFDYRYLLPVLPFACLAAGLAFAPARIRPAPDPAPALDLGPAVRPGARPGLAVWPRPGGWRRRGGNPPPVRLLDLGEWGRGG